MQEPLYRAPDSILIYQPFPPAFFRLSRRTFRIFCPGSHRLVPDTYDRKNSRPECPAAPLNRNRVV